MALQRPIYTNPRKFIGGEASFAERIEMQGVALRWHLWDKGDGVCRQSRRRKGNSVGGKVLVWCIFGPWSLGWVCTDAKSLWEAIKNRFGGNKESKKMQKTILKQNYKNFVASSQEGLDKTYDRNKSDLDTLSIDDLYNNLKVYGSDIKGKSSSSSNSQNVAFVSSDNSSSTNETINTAHSVFTASSKDQASTVSYVDDVMFSFFANQFNALQLDYEDLEQIDADDLEEMDLKWQVA
ncbi:hypothetical protein Tco_1291141, partial [Tanacetum coccineum]